MLLRTGKAFSPPFYNTVFRRLRVLIRSPLAEGGKILAHRLHRMALFALGLLPALFVEGGVAGIEVFFIHAILCHAKRITEALVMHNFSFPQEAMFQGHSLFAAT